MVERLTDAECDQLSAFLPRLIDGEELDGLAPDDRALWLRVDAMRTGAAL